MAYNNYNNNSNNNNSDEEGGSNLQPLNEEAKKMLAAMEPDLKPEYYDQYFLMTKPSKAGKFKISINKAGLFWKLDALYPEHDMKTAFVSQQLHKETKENLGYAPDAVPFLVMESTITIFGEKRDRTFNAFGTVTPDNIKYKKSSKLFANPHLVELAETRADKRVIQKITRCGYAIATNDEEELEAKIEENFAEDMREQARKKFFALINQQGYGKREDYIQLCSSVLKREVDTTKTLTFAEFEKIISYMEGKRSYPPQSPATSPVTPSTAVEKEKQIDPSSPTLEQINEIHRLYEKLKWSDERKNKCFVAYSQKTGRTIFNEFELDFNGATELIIFLNKQPVPQLPPPAETLQIPQVEIEEPVEYIFVDQEPDLNISLDEVPF